PNEPAEQEIIKTPSVMNQRSATIDNGGILWIGTTGLGVERYNPAIERFGALPEKLFLRLAVETVQSIGFPPRKELSNEATPFADMYGYLVFRDSRGGTWYPWNGDLLSSDDALRYNPATQSIDRFPRQDVGEVLTPEIFPRSYYIKFFEDNNGTPWFFGWEVMSAFDSERHSFRHYMIKNGNLMPNTKWREMGEFRITAARKDADGTFWLGVYQEGVFHFNPLTLELQQFSHDANTATSLSNNRVLAITEDPTEPAKYFWVGTEGGGLNKFEKAIGRCTHITTRDGLPNNVVYTIFPDKKGKLWLSTNSGLCSLEPNTMTFRYYDVQDGLQGMEFNRERNYQSPDGRIYLEGTQGVNVFSPEEITENPHIPQVVFTDLKIHGNSVSWKAKDSPLKTSIVVAKEIVLPYDQNILTFEFAALDFSNSGSNEYSYRLEGYSEEWTKPSKEHSATFTNLNLGKYILHVRGSNNDGVWNETGTSLSLSILPPWYRTWWAYICYVGIFITGLYLFRRYDLKRIRLKDQLELAQVRANQLKEVDQLKMKFFQNISHEFRTPLTLILGPIEKLLNGSVPEDTVKRDLRLMRRNAQRLLRLINQLLDISKLEAGGMKLHASKGNFVAFIRGVTMSFHSLAERKEIFFDVHSDVEEIELYFDKEKMEKIIINLLSNAFKFTPDHGEIAVAIDSVTPLPLGEGHGVRAREEVKISIRDTGIGIPPEKLPHIFDRFYQVDSSSTRMQEGTGIGLALVKDLVELHYGTITVTSTPGKGSEFIVTLPLGKSHLKQEEIVDESSEVSHLRLNEVEVLDNASTHIEEVRVTKDEGENEKPILLVIEDNADVREYIKSYLVPMYNVLVAHDGAEGVERAKETIPDLIISDVMMPKMDGYEVCSRLKQDEKTSHIPIILLTAKAAREDKISGLEIGADEYLIKPFDSTELLARVKNLIESRRRLREK
ncbi:MAG: response regulator, partial [Ignavibacteriales bacterium]|nr:response regulator [Ignavibacteriales bacterium]